MSLMRSSLSWPVATRVLLAALAATSVLGAVPAQAGAKAPDLSTKGYDYYLTGSATDVSLLPPGSQMVVLMGGENDIAEPLRRLVDKARGNSSAKVDVVVIRTSGADDYNVSFSALAGVDSVETLVLKKQAAASEPEVNRIVRNADVLFIAGGDQSNYIALWKGTPLEASLGHLRSRRVPIGGSSAGMAVLGDVDYTGENGSVTSAEALADPYDKRITLSTTFITGLPGLAGTTTDTHFHVRDRMGRLVTFLARTIREGLAGLDVVRGIGVDEKTAVVADDGIATVVGSGAAYFLRPTQAADTIAAKTPLAFRNVQVHKVAASPPDATTSVRFNLTNWTRSDDTPPYYLDALSGSLTSTQAGGLVY